MANIVIDVVCVDCHAGFEVTVPVDGYNAWRYKGVSIQVAMPHVSPEGRELLISHTCSDCFDNLFAETFQQV